MRAATPPAPAEPPDQAPAAAAAAAAAAVAAPEEESRKRKLKKGAAASAKKRAAVKVGSLAPSVLNKWAAARKDLVRVNYACPEKAVPDNACCDMSSRHSSI